MPKKLIIILFTIVTLYTQTDYLRAESKIERKEIRKGPDYNHKLFKPKFKIKIIPLLTDSEMLNLRNENANGEIEEEFWSDSIINPYDINLNDFRDTVSVNISGFYPPVVNRVTSDYGFRKRRYRGRMHYGVDIDLNTGDTVRCAFHGIVRLAKKNRSYGNMVIVRHGNGLETLYAHLSKISVNPGDTILAGSPLGLGGNTGRSRGSHLHFETRYKGYPFNSNDYIDFDQFQTKSDTLLLTSNNFDYKRYGKSSSNSTKVTSSSNGSKYFTVKKGDTLSKLALKAGTTVKKICKLNNITPKTILKPGKKIRYS